MVGRLIPVDGPKLEAEIQAVLADVRALVAERDAKAKRIAELERELNGSTAKPVHESRRLGWVEAANFLETCGQFSWARELRREAGVLNND